MNYYSTQGYEIFVPVGSGRVDFVALKDNKLTKVQVKTVAHRRYKDTEYKVGIITSKRSGSSSHYKPEELDEVFIVDQDKAWQIPYIDIYPNISVMLGCNKDSYKPKHNYPVSDWEVQL